MPTWADIQRLAADLQRVQSADSAKKLSEANCIEIISALIDSGSINVVVTNNGKEYVTKKHLVTEVKNECLAAGSRINITELVPILRVELDHIEAAISVLTTEASDEFVLCAGELVSREYIGDVCKRLNERLQEVGQLSMYQLAKTWELPTELLNHYVLGELGTRIEATRFEDQIYTRQFFQLQRNKLRAALVSLTKPTVISTIFSAFDIPQALFFNLWNELAESNQLNGHLIGSKNSIKSVYVPRMHDLLVRSYVKSAYLANDFVETSTLKKLSILDVQSYFKEILPKEKFAECIFLQTGVANQELWQHTVRAIEEHVQSELYCAIDQQLPPSLSDLSDSDLETLIGAVKKLHSNWRVVSSKSEHVIYDPKLIEQTLNGLESWLQEKATADASSIAQRLVESRIQQSKKQGTPEKKLSANDEEDDWGTNKKKGGKGGKKGGTPAAKSKAPAQQASSSDAAIKLNSTDLKDQLQNVITVPGLLLSELLENVQQPANTRYKELIEDAIRTANQVEGKDQRRNHEEKRQRAQLTYEQICVFDSGLSKLPESLSADLRAYLLRSLANEFCVQTLSAFTDCPPDAANLSAKLRDEMIGSISEASTSETLTELFSAQRVSLEKFHEVVQTLQTACSFMITPPDKRRRVDIITEHIKSLREKLETSQDAPTTLLLTVLYLFAQKTDSIVHASGKFVGPLIKHLSGELPADLVSQLDEAQRLVVECVKKKNADDDLNAELIEKLERLKVRVLA